MAKSYKKWRERALRDPKVRKALEGDDDDLCINIAYTILRFRKEANLTQKELAEKMGTTQQTVARLESLDYKGYSLATLAKVAEALDKKLEVHLV